MLTENSLKNCKLTSLAPSSNHITLFHVSLGESECYVEKKPSSGMSCKGKQVSHAVMFCNPAPVQVTFFVHPPVPTISLMSLAKTANGVR